MYLLYADESGDPSKAHFVLGGVAVHEQDAYPLARSVDALFNRLPPLLRDEELHTREVRAGSGRWSRIPKRRRDQLIHDITELLVEAPSLPRPPVLFAVVLHRASFPHHNTYERSYEEFFARCNGMLGRLASHGDRHRCVVIADQSRHIESDIQSAMLEWRQRGASTGASIGPLSAYAEVPLFVNSKASRLVQLADFVAYWVYRGYESGDASVLQRLAPGFDQEGDVLHGLVHLVRDYRTCECLACASRRDAP